MYRLWLPNKINEIFFLGGDDIQDARVNALMVCCGLQHLNCTGGRSSASVTLLAGTVVAVGWEFVLPMIRKRPFEEMGLD